MAFNFNWSPLAADASLYTRAQEMLRAALNKSPKPPIIVDDILVHEMNLGSTPPDLEILEVGDLAEDRFRGIFKMTYAGDAFLTLKTKVQANPLNTYLSTRPSFTSPEPLAAASGLTIPLKITLSDIRLSAFIILVFSKQKGLTLVFRNDPLESLKVSSTFDSISFVRDYLQKEIEGQLRALLMDEMPAIIHRLSLRLWVPEFREKDDQEFARSADDGEPEEAIVNPLDSPPQDPVDIDGNVLDTSQIASLSLDSSAESQALFSRRNMDQLSALANSGRTLSLSSPGLKDVVYRAWTGQLERGERSLSAPLSRMPSHVASHANSDSLSETASMSTRPSLVSFGTSFQSSNLGRHMKPGKKRKHRVINMRKPKIAGDDGESVSGESSNISATVSDNASDNGVPLNLPIPEDREIELQTPPMSPRLPSNQHSAGPDLSNLMHSPQKVDETTPRPPVREKSKASERLHSFKPLFEAGPEAEEVQQISASTETIRPKPQRYFGSWQPPTENEKAFASNSRMGTRSPQLSAPFPYAESSPGGILEQAWMMKMAGEIARRMEAQKQASGPSFWEGESSGMGRHTPPPAYGS